MNKNWVLTQESFDTLLVWLDVDRDEAGQKYVKIRERLIKIFTCRGCLEPEDLADETINRVTRRLSEIKDTFVGEPIKYFCGVANNVYYEYKRRKRLQELPDNYQVEDKSNPQIEMEYNCLESCMQALTPDNRQLVYEYYRENKAAKIENRKKLAGQLGIALNALRIRACRIRASLQECVRGCVQRTQ
jgi:DNA-directed RNA polymerase specialized sigma24 family protein